MRFLQLDETPMRFPFSYGKFLCAIGLFLVFGFNASQAQTQAIRITINTNTGNRALTGWNSSAYQSFSAIGPGCLQMPSGPSELQFVGWASSTSPQSLSVDHVAGTFSSMRPDYTRFDSVAPGVYQLEIHFNSFFGDPNLLPKSATSCFSGSPSLLSQEDTIYNLVFKVRGDSVGTSFLDFRCGAIPDCDCNPSCIGGISTATFREPGVGGYYIIQNLHTGTPVLLDSTGNRVSPIEALVEVIQPYDLQLTSFEAPDTQYYARPIMHATSLDLSVLAENKGYDYVRGIEVEASVYDENNNMLSSSTSTLDKLKPFDPGYLAKQTGETKIITFPKQFLPKHAGLYRVEYIGTSVSKDGNLANNQVTQYFQITDSTFARDNGQPTGTHTLQAISPTATVGAIGQVFDISHPDSLTSITMALDLTNHTVLQGFPTIQAGLYAWDPINLRPDTLVDTSFSYQLQFTDVGKILSKTFSLSQGASFLASGKYVIVMHQYGAAYQVPVLYSSAIYESGTLWESNGTYPPISSSWQEITDKQGALHLRPNFGKTYCSSTSEFLTGSSIHQVLIEGASCTSNHTSSHAGASYTLFNAEAADVIPGNTYDIQIILTDSGQGPFKDRKLAVFVDWNEDFDFDDPGESMGELGPVSGGMPSPIQTFHLPIPENASIGTKRLRLICTEGPFSGPISPCGTYKQGETEDHLIQVVPYLENEEGYCEASALLYDDLVITRVTIIGEQSSINLAINEPEVGSRYSDFTSQQVTLNRTSSYNLSLSIGDAQGNYQSLDKNRGFKVFIDWDQDGVFDPVTELADSDIRLNFNGPGPVNMTITVPASAKSGVTRMRIIAQRTSNLSEISPCGFFDKGEVEDYSIYVPSDQVSLRSLPPISNPSYQIKKVSLPGENIGISKLTTCPTTSPVPVYHNFRNNLTDVIRGKDYDLEVIFDSCSFSNTLDSGKIFVYADWNKDGDLEDANEVLYELPFINGVNPAFDVNGQPVMIPLRIPPNAGAGFLSLFVEVATVGASGKITNEVEEYTLIILSPQDVGVSQIFTSFQVFGGAQTPISIQVCNWGRETVYSVPVEVSIGPYDYSFTITDSIEANTCITVPIDTLDTRDGAIWHIQAQTFLPDDGDPSNNSRQVSVSFGEIPNLDADTFHFCKLDTAFLINPSDKATYYWYDTLTGGTAIDTGTYFIPDSLNQPITYYVQGVTSSSDSLSSWYPDSAGYFAEVGQQGNIVDVTAKTALSIESFDLNLYTKAGNDSAVSIYYKLGTYHGFERNPLAWQLLSTDTLTSNGLNNKTRLTLSQPLPIATGQTIGFYLVGPLANAIFLPFLSRDLRQEENNDLITESGLTNCSPNPMTAGCLFGVRYWSSVIHYSKGSESERLPITLTFDQLPPAVICQNPTVVLDTNGIATLLVSDVDGGTVDNCELDTLMISRDSFFCPDVGVSTLILTAIDSRNNIDSCEATVTINDPFFPDALCQGATLSLDASGSASILPSHVDAGSEDNCVISSITTNPSSLGCANIGANSVILRVEDQQGNVSACLAPVTILEEIPPLAVCQAITLPLDPGGAANLIPAQIDGGSSDNCGISSFGLSDDNFNCNDLGTHLITLKIADGQGLTDSCQTTVTIVDLLPPVSICQSLTLTLDALGEASLTPVQLDAGSSDNCGPFSYTVSQDTFTCADVGSNQLTLTLTDVNGNSEDCFPLVFVQDTVSPTMICQPMTLTLDANGEALLAPSVIDNGSSDFCGITTLSLSQDSFDCSDIGMTILTLTGKDQGDNISFCQANVTIQDIDAPTAICQDVTVALDINGIATLAISQVDNGSSDNCNISSISLNKQTYTCADLGLDTVLLQLMDDQNNASTCQAIVTIADNIFPTANCNAVTLSLDVSGSATLSISQVDNGSSDNCSITQTTLSQTNFDCTDVGTSPIDLTVTDINNNSQNCQAAITIIDPFFPVAICQSVTLSLDSDGTALLSSGQIDNGSFDNCSINSLLLSQDSFSCAEIGITSVSLTAEDNSGNIDSCQAIVTIQDQTPPDVSCNDIILILDANGDISLASSQIDAGSSDNCGISNLTAAQINFTCTDLGINMITLKAIDGEGNVDSCQSAVTVTDNAAPDAICQPTTLYLDASGVALLTASDVDGGSNDNCAIDTFTLSQTAFGCADLGNNNITLITKDASNNINSCQAVVTVKDSMAPVMNCQSVTLSLDITGSATLTTNQVDGGTADVCGINSLTLSKTSFDCNDIGTAGVILTAIDSQGNSNSCQAMVTIEDNISPLAACQNLTLSLDTNGNASLSSSQVDAGSNDNCGISSMSISQNAFSCSNLGGQNVTLSVIDGSNNTQTCQASITIVDNIAPSALCQSVVLHLDASGQANLTTGQVDNGSNDNCSIDTLTLSQTSFTCIDRGTQTVTLSAIDISNNQADCQSLIMVIDSFSPVMTCQDITIYLNSNGLATLAPNQVDDGSMDACGIEMLSVSKTTFNCNEIGLSSVTLTAVDSSGNSNSCLANVTLQDTTPPLAACQDISLGLDQNGVATLASSQIDAGSNDNCAVNTLVISQTAFSCNDVGANSISLQVKDVNNNTQACQATVTVLDQIPPTAICQPTTLFLDATGNVGVSVPQLDGGSNDNCQIDTTILNDNDFTCSDIGANTITLTTTDESGNTADCQSVVTVIDSISPTILCQNVTLALGANGTSNMTAQQVDGGSIDNCGIDSLSVSSTSFSCSDIGTNNVLLTAWDGSGNARSCSAMVEVVDTLPPLMNCQASVTLVLNTSGNATLAVGQVDNGTADNCTLDSLSLSRTFFDTLRSYNVYLRGVDIYGNTDSCLTVVAVQDTAAPTMVCQAVTVYLDGLGQGSLAPADVDNGSSDRSGNLILSLDKSTFICADLGATQVTLTGTSINQQSAFCLANVTIQDTIPPTVNCQAVSLSLDNQGKAQLAVSQVHIGSNDNCGIASLYLSQDTFSCNDIPSRFITLTAEDNGGNTSTCISPVAIQDIIAPHALCQDVTLYLDANGTSTLNINQVNNGSDDNCGIGSISLDKSIFTCSTIGRNTVTLAVEDVNTNQATCQAFVTVLDSISPTMVCLPATLSLDVTGSASLLGSQIDGGSIDNCSISTLTPDQNSFDCSHIGTHTVILTGADSSGNTAQCSATVIIQDTIPPTVVCSSTDLYLDGTGAATLTPAQVDGGSQDICGIANLGINQTQFSCSDIGTQAIILTATDSSGNNDQCAALVIIRDTVSPNMLCQAVTLTLAPNRQAQLTVGQIDAGSNDNCLLVSTSLSKTTFTSTDVGQNSVSLTGRDAQNNVGICLGQVTIIDTIPPNAVCQNATVALDGNGSATVSPTQIDAGSNDIYPINSLTLDQTNFTCSDIGQNAVTLTVTNANGYSASCQAFVQIIDALPPAMNCQPVNVDLDADGIGTLLASQVDGGSIDNCAISSLTIDKDSFFCADVGQAISITLTATDANNNSATCSASVTVRDLLPPTMSCNSVILQLDASGNATLTANQVDAGSTDNCGISILALNQSNFTCSNSGINPLTLIAIDNNGQSATCQTNVFVQDLSPPTMVCQDITLVLSASGTVSLTANQIDGGTVDNCGVDSLNINRTSFTCSDLGPQTVTLEAKDESGNSDDCQAIVTIVDNTPPTAVCQPLTLQLNAIGMASILPTQLDAGSNDVCGVGAITLSQDSFVCADIGQNAITLTVSDTSNNTSSCQAMVTVQDLLPPAMNCQPTTIYLNQAGFATLSSFQVNAGSFDNCVIDSLALSQQSFGIGDLGVNNVFLIGTDLSGNKDSCLTLVTVLDTMPPSMKCQDISVFLNSNGQGQITANQIDGGSSDKLGMLSLSIDKSQFACIDKGPNIVTLTGTNSNALSSTCQAIVTVIDSFPPIANCQNQSLSLDANGAAMLTAAQVNSGSMDNCGIATFAISKDNFACTDTGQQTITLTTTDESGNTASCLATITITDNQAPIALCQATTLSLDQDGNTYLSVNQLDNGSNDNCGIASLTLDQDSFSCNEIGQSLVTLTAKDYSSNRASCQASVTIRDTLPPVMNCKPATLVLDAVGKASLTIGQIDNGTTDNCGLDSLAISQDSFGIGDIGQNFVVLTGVDIYGNVDSCSTIVNVQDSTAPTMVCRSLSLPLDANGMASLAVSDVDGGSSDIAGFTSLGISQTNFSCSDLGQILVALTGTNTRGISASCQAQVFVIDTISPIVTCQNQTLTLDANGTAALAMSDVNAGSMDNCGITAYTLSQNSFTCSDVGQSTITLTAKDTSDNTTSCQAQVSIQDITPPAIVCQNLTLSLDANGDATLTTQAVDGGSLDNCGIVNSTINKNSFTCNDIGTNLITLTTTDASGNSSSCQSQIQVEDNLAPNVLCQNLTLTLDATGTASLTTAQVDAGSNDNCGINSLNISRNTFTCSDIGTHTVILAATDAQGSNGSCQAIITVQDVDPPVLVCQPATLYLDSNGNANLIASQLDAGSSDNCGIASLLISQATFSCADVGQNQITLTARDGQNLLATCQTQVTILDTLSPVIQCMGVTLTLDSLGMASLAVSQVNAGSSDNCGIDTLVLSQTQFNIVDLGQNTISLTATDVNGNIISCNASVSVQALNLPSMICRNATVQLDANGNASLAVSDIDAGSSDTQGLVSLQISSSQFTCADLGTQMITLTGTNVVGNSASCMASIQIQDTIPPTAICQSAVLNLNVNGNAFLPGSLIDGGSNDNCQISSLVASPDNFTCSNIGLNTVTLTAIDEAGNMAICSTQVQIHDPIAPVASCNAASLYLNSSGAATLSASLINAGSQDNCSISILALSKSNFTCADEGQNIVTLIAIDGTGNSSTCQSIVSVLDTLAPLIQCQSDTLLLDGNGMASLTTAQINGGVSDNCTLDSLRLSQQVFTRSQVGQNAVSLIAVDIFGNVDSCIAMITVRDTTGPTMACQSVALTLDASGIASLAGSDIDAGSSDQYGLSSLIASPNLFSCANKGSNTVTLTGTNNNGIMGSCQTTVFIQDMLPPVMVCQNVTLPLNAMGTASLLSSQIDGGSMDNCGIASSALSKVNFDCSDVGTNQVTFAATDSSSNFSSCQATITVQDNQIPTVTCQAITVAIDAQGRGDILPSQVDAGSSDNCRITLALNDSSFDCSDIGQQFVALIVTDADNNTASCQAGVLIEDTTPPDLNCQQVVLHLDAQGQSILTPAQIDAGSSDNCGITSLVLSKDTFTCSDIGNQLVSLTAKDAQDNTSDCQTTVRVLDSRVPTMMCKSATVYLNANGQGTLSTVDVDAGSSDNCGITTLLVGRSAFDCEDIGPQNVPLVAIDGSGNSDGCLAPVMVQDTLAPIARCQPATLILDANGAASLTVAQVDAGSDDNCGLQSLVLSRSTFTCADPSPQNIQLTAIDSSGNRRSCQALITLQDTTPAPSISVVGDTAFCEGGQVTLIASAGFLNYNWSTGSSDLSIQVTTSDTIRLSVSYAPGCWTPFSVPQVINVDPAIPLPQILQIGMDSLQCSIPNGNTYTWFRNDTLLTPQTRTIFAGQNGEYKVFVERGLCTSDTSVIHLVNTDLIDDLLSRSLTLYPNPNKGIFFLRGDIGTSSLVEIEIYSMGGKQVFEKQTFAPGGKLDEVISLRGVADGVYMLRVRVNGGFYYRKVEVVR